MLTDLFYSNSSDDELWSVESSNAAPAHPTHSKAKRKKQHKRSRSRSRSPPARSEDLDAAIPAGVTPTPKKGIFMRPLITNVSVSVQKKFSKCLGHQATCLYIYFPNLFMCDCGTLEMPNYKKV